MEGEIDGCVWCVYVEGVWVEVRLWVGVGGWVYICVCMYMYVCVVEILAI